MTSNPSYYSSAIIDDKDMDVEITEKEESVLNIESIEAGDWGVSGITGIEKGFIVVTGEASEFHSHVTIVDRRGGGFKQTLIKSSSFFAYRYCDYLSHYKVATVCEPAEVGIYDVRDGAYECKIVVESVSCLTTDRVNERIIVGGEGSNDLSVYDARLKYCYNMSLPEVLEFGPCDMAVNGGDLLVCGNEGRAFAVTMAENSVCKLVCEFAQPDGQDWESCSVCTDSHGLVYVLWRREDEDQEKSILVQYRLGQDGCKVLQTRSIDSVEGARCITAMDTGRGEKIIIASCKKGKLIVYGLRKKSFDDCITLLTESIGEVAC